MLLARGSGNTNILFFSLSHRPSTTITYLAASAPRTLTRRPPDMSDSSQLDEVGRYYKLTHQPLARENVVPQAGEELGRMSRSDPLVAAEPSPRSHQWAGNLFIPTIQLAGTLWWALALVTAWSGLVSQRFAICHVTVLSSWVVGVSHHVCVGVQKVGNSGVRGSLRLHLVPRDFLFSLRALSRYLRWTVFVFRVYWPTCPS